MDSSVLHPSWPRAAANALWPRLRQANEVGWPSAAWTVNDPTGNPRTSGHSTTPGTPGPTPRTEPTAERILTLAHPEDWPGEQLLGIYLTREAHDAVLAERGRQTRYEYDRALRLSTARVPFTLDKNRHGTPILRRNPEITALITPMVALLLEAFAQAARVEVITPERAAKLEEALIGDDDVDDPMNASVALAIAERAGVGT